MGDDISAAKRGAITASLMEAYALDTEHIGVGSVAVTMDVPIWHSREVCV